MAANSSRFHTPNTMTKCKAATFLNIFQPGKLKSCPLSWSNGIDESGEEKRWRSSRIWLAVALLGWNAAVVPGGYAATHKPADGAAAKTITVWTHEDAASREFAALKEAAEKFNRRQHVYRVEITSSLRRDYQGWVHREAANGTLPCLLEFDGPLLAEFAWLQYLQPIDQFVPPELLNNFLPSIVAQGTYHGRLYSLGQYDSGMGLWGNRRYLLAAGVRIPTLQSPWSQAEFEKALIKLAALKGVSYAINFSLPMKYGEFYAYAYAPILQSFGGDLINRHGYRTAKGVLDGPPSVAAMKHFQRWVQKGWTRDALTQSDDFEKGKAALSWQGHWVHPSYHKALGKDLVLMPMPDFGQGIRTGMGSWTWGISSTCHAPAGAWSFLAHLLSTKEIVRMTNINHAIPARRSALAQSPLYGARGPLRFFVQQLEAGGVPRPPTPAYGTISKIFGEAVGNIVAGADVQAELSHAANSIDQTIAANRGYPYP